MRLAPLVIVLAGCARDRGALPAPWSGWAQPGCRGIASAKPDPPGRGWYLATGTLPGALWLVKVDPHRDGVVFAAGWRGIYCSADRAATWHPVYTDPELVNVFDLAFDPDDPSLVYATVERMRDGRPRSGFLVSRDGGASFSRTGLEREGAGQGVVLAIGGRLLTSGEGGIWASDDQGASFTPVDLGEPGATGSSLVQAGTEVLATYLLLGRNGFAYGSGMLRSMDAGRTWAPAGAGLPDGSYWLRTDPSSPRPLYAKGLDRAALYRSDDGARWFEVAEGRSSYSGFAVEPGAPHTLFVEDSYGLRRSRDAGATWSPYLVGPANGGVVSAAGGTLAVGAGGTVYRTPVFSGPFIASHDEGDTWVAATSIVYGATALAVDPRSADVVYGGDGTGNLFRTMDGGRNWSLRDAPVAPDRRWRPARAIVLDPLDPDTVYLAVSEAAGGVWRSTGGTPWQATGLAGDVRVLAAVAPHRLYAATRDGVHRSDDGGDHWTRVLATGGAPLAVAPSDGDTIYVAGGLGDVWRSRDGGATWASAHVEDAKVTAIAVAPDAPASVYVATGLGSSEPHPRDFRHLLHSDDGGVTWSLRSDLQKWTSVLLAGPAGALYAAEAESGHWDGIIAKSSDGGHTWRPASEGLPRCQVETLAVAPSAPSILYAGTSCGILRSDTAGE